MLREVKRWGNGIAIRLPRNDPEIGRLNPGDEVEVTIRAVGRTEAEWTPPTINLGDPTASQNIDHYLYGHPKRVADAK